MYLSRQKIGLSKNGLRVHEKKPWSCSVHAKYSSTSLFSDAANRIEKIYIVYATCNYRTLQYTIFHLNFPARCVDEYLRIMFFYSTFLVLQTFIQATLQKMIFGHFEHLRKLCVFLHFLFYNPLFRLHCKIIF